MIKRGDVLECPGYRVSILIHFFVTEAESIFSSCRHAEENAAMVSCRQSWAGWKSTCPFSGCRSKMMFVGLSILARTHRGCLLYGNLIANVAITDANWS